MANNPIYVVTARTRALSHINKVVVASVRCIDAGKLYYIWHASANCKFEIVFCPGFAPIDIQYDARIIFFGRDDRSKAYWLEME